MLSAVPIQMPSMAPLATDEDAEDDDEPPAAIVGAAVGVGCVLFLACVAGYKYMVFKQKKQQQAETARKKEVEVPPIQCEANLPLEVCATERIALVLCAACNDLRAFASVLYFIFIACCLPGRFQAGAGACIGNTGGKIGVRPGSRADLCLTCLSDASRPCCMSTSDYVAV